MQDNLNKGQKKIKRLFDLFFSFIGFVVFMIPISILIAFSTISTRKFGLFKQKRIGLAGEVFVMFKIRSMKSGQSFNEVTVDSDPRITGFGRFMRANKLDELPQLWNVIKGDMSLVGPRPDIAGYADKLEGSDRIILNLRPGITGPATLKYKNEEMILSQKNEPLKYNDEVIWKDKVEINKEYIRNWSLKGDIRFILKTIFT